MAPAHIAMFSDFHPTTLGGISITVDDQRRELMRRGHRVTLFTPPAGDDVRPGSDGDPDLVELAPAFGLSVNGFPAVFPSPTNTTIVDDAFRARGPVDLVHVHTTYGVGAIGVRSARRQGVPLVQTMHSRDDRFIEMTSPAPYPAALAMRVLHGRFVSHRGGIPRVAESAAAHNAWQVMVAQARAADAVIAPTRHFADKLRAHGVGGGVHAISNGVDDALVDDLRGPRDLHRPPDDEPQSTDSSLRAVWCGRLSAEKRPDVAVEAALATDGIILDVIGDGDQLDAVRTRAAGSERITVHGRLSRPDTLDRMARADVLLFTSSDFDTQGLTLLEARALGLPIVYCDPALAETISPGTGFAAADDSAAAIGAVLAHLRDHPDAVRAARTVAADDDVRQSVQTEKIIDLYRHLIDDDRTRAELPSSPGAVPVAPGAVPILGHSLIALRKGLGFVKDLGAAGPVVRLDLGPQQAYVLTTPDLVREVGLRTAGDFHRDDLKNVIHEAIREASNVLTGSRHELRRRQMAPALRARRLAEYAVTTAGIADRWAAELPANRRVDLKTAAHALILETITSTLFTADFSAGATARMRETVPWLLGQVIVRGALPPAVGRLRVLANRRFATRSAELRTAIAEVVAAYRRADRDYHDVLSVLVSHVDPESGTGLTDDEIVDELILMTAAGVGSTASILSWVWYEIMRDDAIAARVHAEVDAVLGENIGGDTGGDSGARTVRAEHLPEFVYLRRVVHETLRMWGPWISSQTADGEVTFGSGADRLTLPDGAMVIYSPYQIHHDPAWYRDPEHFDPDRWSPERAHEIDKRAVLPFGVGERHCPGNNFAISTILLATAALFARWDAMPVGDKPVTPSTTDFVASPSALPTVLTPHSPGRHDPITDAATTRST